MKNYQNKDDFKAYKVGLEQKISDLEKSIDLSPSSLIQEINPFKKSKEQTKSLVPMSKNNSVVFDIASKTILKGILGKRFGFLAATLLPITSSGTAKLIDFVKKESYVEKLLDKVIDYTTLTPEEEQLLIAAEIEDQIRDINNAIVAS